MPSRIRCDAEIDRLVLGHGVEGENDPGRADDRRGPAHGIGIAWDDRALARMVDEDEREIVAHGEGAERRQHGAHGGVVVFLRLVERLHGCWQC